MIIAVVFDLVFSP